MFDIIEDFKSGLHFYPYLLKVEYRKIIYNNTKGFRHLCCFLQLFPKKANDINGVF